MTIAAIRKALRNAFGPRKYRITKNGEIHVFGLLPNTSTAGWYLFGFVGEAETEARIQQL